MSNIEAAVVVYLRELYYPEGFRFPLKLIPEKFILIELSRELSTIIMLIIVASLCGKLMLERFFYFIYTFGVWDIFYYLWLKVFLNWPESLRTDDLLFLIPVPWIAPVYAPIVVSLSMIIFSLISIYLQQKGFYLKVNKMNLLVAICGIALILYSFIWDFQNRINTASPVKFLWYVFLIGELFIVISFLLFIGRLRKYQDKMK